MPTGGELLVRGLAAAGVEVAFGLPGVHNLAAWKAFPGSGIRLVGVRHEQTAAYAADGYARATGRLGVALTTTGPGAANTLGAVGEAWASRSPILVIATDIPTTLRRPGTYRGVLHETTDQAAMFAPVTKATVRVAAANEIMAAVQLAAFTAQQAPARPVYLEVPTDLLSAAVEGGHLEASVPAEVPRLVPAAADVARAAALLEQSERPLLWVGGGAVASQAAPEVAMLAERLGAPVLLTYGARGLLGDEHPCQVGLPPHVPEAGQLWDDADLVVAVGSDFDGMTTQNWAQPAPQRLVAINVDAADATKNYPADAVLVGDAAAGLQALLERVPERAGLVERADDLAARRARARTRLAAEHPDEVGFLDALEAILPPEAVVVADMCIPGYWFGGFGTVHGPRRLAYPVGWGTLGFAFPAAIGAALSGRGPVVALAGDGGFLYACGDLATVAQEQLPLTVVVVDDGGYGMLRFDQRHAGDDVFGVDLHTPDFAALASAFGIRADTVDGLGEAFGAALAEHVADPAPTLLVARAALEPPPTTSPRWYRRPR